MMTLILAGTLSALAMTAGTETYADAHRMTSDTGKPMLVMVGADWCGPCQNLKNNILPQVRHRGLLSRVAFAQVNVDREPELTQSLTGGGPIPQLVMYRKTAHGWRQRKLVGAQSVAQVEEFINQGLTLDADAKTAEKANAAVPQTTDLSTKATIHPISTH